MKRLFYTIIFLLILMPFYTIAQCDFTKPNSTSTFDYANRAVTFTNTIINGQARNVIYVNKGEDINIQTDILVKKSGNYCPGCIVQIYWGINNYTSTCAVSFGGYNANKKKSKHRFNAPDKEGVYYVTMGGTLDYSCKNNIIRPNCGSQWAFAVVIVGKPNSEKDISLEIINQGNEQFFKTELFKSGCFGTLTDISWYYNNQLIDNEKSSQIKITSNGIYRVVWKNCVGDSIFLEKNYPITTEENTKVDTSDISFQIKNSNKFILKNLVFASQSAELNLQSKKELDKLIKILKDNPTMKILLEGHTDVLGNPKSNQKLSEDRVKSTKNYLVKNDISNNRIQIKGYGATKPLYRNATPELQQLNRRVEVIILSR